MSNLTDTLRTEIVADGCAYRLCWLKPFLEEAGFGCGMMVKSRKVLLV